VNPTFDWGMESQSGPNGDSCQVCGEMFMKSGSLPMPEYGGKEGFDGQ